MYSLKLPSKATYDKIVNPIPNDKNIRTVCHIFLFDERGMLRVFSLEFPQCANALLNLKITVGNILQIIDIKVLKNENIAPNIKAEIIALSTVRRSKVTILTFF